MADAETKDDPQDSPDSDPDPDPEVSTSEKQKESESEEDDGGFEFDEILETINDVIKSLQGKFETEGARKRYEQGTYEGPIILASNEEVVTEAVQKMGDLRQRRKAIELGYEDEDKIKKIQVDLDIPEDPVPLVKEFDNLLAEVRQPIVDEIERRKSGADKNPMVQDEEPIMTYIFEENAGAYGDVTIIGGAKAIVFNLCEQYGYTDDERELIRKCHEIAADKNGVERHTLVEDIVMAPQFKHENI